MEDNGKCPPSPVCPDGEVEDDSGACCPSSFLGIHDYGRGQVYGCCKKEVRMEDNGQCPPEHRVVKCGQAITTGVADWAPLGRSSVACASKGHPTWYKATDGCWYNETPETPGISREDEMWELSWHLTLQLTEQEAQCASIDALFAVDDNAQFRLNDNGSPGMSQFGEFDAAGGATLSSMPQWFNRFNAGDNLLEMATNPTHKVEGDHSGGIYVIGVLKCDCEIIPETSTPSPSPSPSPSSSECKTGPQGCTYESACNFDEAAELDNGSCEFAKPGFSCEGESVCNEAPIDIHRT